MLRYRFGFPGIFFLFNVWWGDKSNWQNGKYKIFCSRNQVHQFQVLELLPNQDTGQTCGKLRWEVSLIGSGIIWRLSFFIRPIIWHPKLLWSNRLFDPRVFSHHASYLTLNPVILDQTAFSFLPISTQIPLVSGRCFVSLPTLQVMRDTSTILKVTKCQS